MGTRNNDISLKLAKAVKQGFLPDVYDSEVDILEKEARSILGNDAGFQGNYATRKQLDIARRLVVANTFGSADTVAQVTAGSYDVPAVIGANTADISFVYGNHYAISESNLFVDKTPTTSVTIGGAALVIPGVAIYPLTFNGEVGVTVTPGGFIESDPLPLELDKGTLVYLRTYVSGGTWYANHISGGQTGNGGYSASNLTVVGSSNTALASAGSHYGPMAVLGTVSDNTPAYVIQGDSIAHGFGDGNYFTGYVSTDTYRAGGGFLQRAFSGKVGSVNIAISGDKASAFSIPNGYIRRAFFKKYATHSVIEYPRNDISDEITLATTQANVIKIAKADKKRGLRTVLTTTTPKTTSTDNWFTVENQTPSTAGAEVIRKQWNAWLRDGAPMSENMVPLSTGTTSIAIRIGDAIHPFDAYWEITNLLESEPDSGRWKAAERVVTDGATTSGSSLFSSATAAFTSADLGKTLTAIGAGSAGALYSSVIRQVNSSTQVTCNSNAGTTLAGATFALGVVTVDGTHPNQYGAIVGALGVDTTELT